MEEVIPLFKSHYSLGRSILTLQKPKEEPDDKADSIFDICTEFDLKELFLVEDNMSSFLEAYSNAEELKIKLNFGLRLTFCEDMEVQSEESRKNSYKNIIFAKNVDGYKQLIKIYTDAAQKGFYYEPRIDSVNLQRHWTEDLILTVPFYDSFLYNNKYTSSKCVPDFSFTSPVFLVEDNDLLLDKDMAKAVSDFCGDKYEVFRAKSIFYKNKEDFAAYLAARCISKRTTIDKPNFDGMCSDEFSYESYREVVNG